MKKILSFCMGVAVVFAAVAGFAGCKEKVKGTIYVLWEAYSEGFLSKEDLEQIAYYNNNNVAPEEELNPEIEQAIKETVAEAARNDAYNAYPEADAKDYKITGYYGEYNGCFAFRTNNPYAKYPDEPFQEWVEIGGVEFRFGYIRTQIWKRNV